MTERRIEQKKVAGAGGRLRTVYICEMKCWHNSYRQAFNCKNALARIKDAS